MDFCALFDLDISSSSVSFDRHKTASINLKEITLPLQKSQHLVLSKNKKSLGEVSRKWQLSDLDTFEGVFFAVQVIYTAVFKHHLETRPFLMPWGH